MQYLERNWRNPSDIPDFRQDVYVRVYEAAQKDIPEHAGKFVDHNAARNLLIDKAKHARIIPIEAAANPDEFGTATDAPGPERIVLARDELRHLQAALDRLPPQGARSNCLAAHSWPDAGRNCPQDGHQRNQCQHVICRARICTLADTLHGEPSNIRRKPMNQFGKRWDDDAPVPTIDMRAANYVERRDSPRLDRQGRSRV